MKRWNGLFSIALSLWLPTIACSFPVQTPNENSGEQSETDTQAKPLLVSAEAWLTLSQKQLTARLSPYGISARNGITIYKVSYQTKSLDESPIQASGIVIVPDTKAKVYPWISLQHGTITSVMEAPSATPFEGLVEGSQGFVTVVADYIGYGDARDLPHPYIIEKGYQTSLVDLLRATREWAGEEKVHLGPLFLKGYSEGGYATLALQKELETHYAEEFPITASAPSAGPYDVDLTGRIAVSKSLVSPVNIPFVVLSYNYWLANGSLPLNEIFQPAKTTLEEAFSGAYDSSEVSQLLPENAGELFQAEFRTDFLSAEPTLPAVKKLHALLQSQSLLVGWQPKTPTRFYHCEDDEQIPVDVTRATLEAFQKLGKGTISSAIIPSPDPKNPYRHGTCPAVFSPVQWFGEILMPEAS